MQQLMGLAENTATVHVCGCHYFTYTQAPAARWYVFYGKSQIPLRYPGRRPTASCNLAYHALSSSLARASRSSTGRTPVRSWSTTMSATSLGPGLRPG